MSPNPDPVHASLAVPAALDLGRTVRGAKQPLMIGPTESLWSTRTPEGCGTLRLERTNDTTVKVQAWGPGREWLVRQAPKLLGFNDDSSAFVPPPNLRDLWRRSPIVLPRTDILWDALVGAVFGQKVQVHNAVKARRLLSRHHGERAPGPAKGWILPAPETVARMGYHQFHRFGVERKRAEILIGVAREMPRLNGLTSKPPSAVATRLQAIRGVGPWTAAMVTAVALGHADAVPVGDFHLPNTVAWALAGEPRADDARMLELLEPYAGQRWRVIRLAKASGGAPKYGPRLSYTDDGLHRGS